MASNQPNFVLHEVMNCVTNLKIHLRACTGNVNTHVLKNINDVDEKEIFMKICKVFKMHSSNVNQQIWLQICIIKDTFCLVSLNEPHDEEICSSHFGTTKT